MPKTASPSREASDWCFNFFFFFFCKLYGTHTNTVAHTFCMSTHAQTDGYKHKDSTTSVAFIELLNTKQHALNQRLLIKCRCISHHPIDTHSVCRLHCTRPNKKNNLCVFVIDVEIDCEWNVPRLNTGEAT